MKKCLILMIVIVTIGLVLVSFTTLSNKAPLSISENAGADQELLESFYSNKAEYESAYASVENQSIQRVVAGIVSHHFLAKNLIADFFTGIDPTNVETVYVVGPDHFSALTNSGQLAVSTLLNWQTPFGILTADQNAISQLVANNIFSLENHPFYTEHSIYTLVPFIKRSIPNAKIMPIILSTKLSDDQALVLGQKLVSKNAIVIVSSDFAHQVSLEEAKSLDEKSILELRDLSLDSLDQITNDCRQCLALLTGYLFNQDSIFELKANKTSANYGSIKADDLTSYISAYYRL